jgi:biopolymer transport protein ExbB
MPLLRAQTLTLDRPLGMIATLATAMPLLGLLGTVLGMTQTFSALTDRGQAPIDALAGGVSQALITTQAGLVMAVPVVLMHGILTSRVRRWTSAATTAIKRLESAVCRD